MANGVSIVAIPPRDPDDVPAVDAAGSDGQGHDIDVGELGYLHRPVRQTATPAK
jgi:hypothetical protein